MKGSIVMADKIDYEKFNAEPMSRQEAVVLAAASTIDFSGKTLIEVQRQLLDRVVTMKKFIGPNSAAYRLAGAIPINATITNIEQKDPKSTRLYIEFLADNSTDGEVEHIRSDRTDGLFGEEVKKMWEGMVGEHVTIYKYAEKTNDPKRPVTNVAPFVKKLPKRS